MGIAAWRGPRPIVTKNTDPAFADTHFATIASAVTSDSVIAHVRAATVGRVAMENTHPFKHGPWVLAHNGTIGSFEHVATHLDIGYYGPAEGDTDSELAFLWILNRMREFGLDPDEPAADLEPIVDLLADSVLELVRISIEVGAPEQPKLNFLLSDGKHLAASRFGNSLHWNFRRGISDCTVCGTSHCPQADADYRAVMIASEPITDEDWMEVPEGSVIGVNADSRTMTRSLAPTSSAA